MRLSSRVVCVVSGFALYNIVVVHIGGVLAAVAIPREYFLWFGEHKTLALVLEEAVVFALPVFLFSLGWSYLTVRRQGPSIRQATVWCLIGLSLAWASWLLYIVASLVLHPLQDQLPLGTLLFGLVVPPLWGILSMAAAPLGIVVAGALSQWSNPSIERTA